MTKLNQAHRGYVSYLLRLWQVQENDHWLWRASLESSQSGQKWFFANLEDLMRFMYTKASELALDCEGHNDLQSGEKQGE
ncbi:MAG: hypothetical protein R3293_15040 [Candidatus Promineifilaceae bacterium]|nr:hypothetical protein [Candidatus Promineifilaceae bacterium]